MTAPALTWAAFDPRLVADRAPTDRSCSYPDCPGEAVLMRGARQLRMRGLIPWKPYCRSHASMYGALLRGRHLVTRTRMPLQYSSR